MIGDVILGKSVDNPTALKVGDIITYRGSGQTEGLLVTHKVVVAPYKTADGTYKLQTKGIANDTPDPEISTEDVLYIMVCKLGFIDTLYNLFFSPWGLLIFIAALLLIFIDEPCHYNPHTYRSRQITEGRRHQRNYRPFAEGKIATKG